MQITIAKKDEILEGGRKIFAVGEKRLALFNVGGEYYCIGDICSHDDGPVAEGECDGYSIECPRHSAKFDLRDGSVLYFPAIRGIPSYPVEIVGDELTIDID